MDEVQDIMGEHGKSIGKELDVMTGNKYHLEGKLENTFETTYGYVEDTIDEKLGNKYLGIIPTSQTKGGLYTQPKVLFTKGEMEEATVGIKLVKNEKGEDMVSYQAVGSQKGNKDKKIDYTNGLLNTKKDVVLGGTNQTLSEEEMNILNSGGTITKKVLWNPTHGIIGDTLEAGVDKVSAWISPLVPQGAKYISSGNAKQLSKMKEENPNKFDGTVYHSQATLIDIASNNNLIADGKEGF